MAKIIAVAGKGGVGKTTLTGLMIQYLCENGKTPILAVDADANSNLNEVLGVEAPPTLGEIREEIERAGMALNSPIPAGMAKGDYLQMRLEDAITEEKGFDLMVMGRTQGQGCYCFVMDWCRPKFSVYKQTTLILWWITKRAWSILAVACFPPWMWQFWSVIAPAGAFRRRGGSRH